MKVLVVLIDRNHITHNQCRSIKIRNNYIKVETDDDKIYTYLIDKVNSFTVERD